MAAKQSVGKSVLPEIKKPVSFARGLKPFNVKR
jgi:hypothetical protein